MGTTQAIILAITVPSLLISPPKHGWTMARLQENAIAKLTMFGLTYEKLKESFVESQPPSITRRLMTRTRKTMRMVTLDY